MPGETEETLRRFNRPKARQITAPEVMMSQTPEWYQDRGNLSRAKDVLQHIPAVTTDQNESRNMYQMLMNQMKGGDRGARLIDTTGLPAGARRIGRTLFTDPAKSQGFFGDVGSLFTGKNKAAVRAQEYNPFPKAGFGEEYYKDKFPWASALGNLTGLAEKSPTLSMLASLFPKKERIPLERDPRYTPVEGSADWESSIFDPIEGEVEEVSDLDLFTPYVENAQMDIKHLYPYHGRGELSEDFDYSQFPSGVDEDITETITEDDGEKFELQVAKGSDLGNLGVGNEYSPNLDLNIMNIQDYELKKKATDAAIQFNNVWMEGEDGEYYGQLEDLYQEYLDAVEAGAK